MLTMNAVSWKWVSEIDLTPTEMETAGEVGVERNRRDRGLASTRELVEGKSAEDNNIMAAQGELAFCKMYGIEWKPGGVDTPDARIMGVTWDVKTSENLSRPDLRVGVPSYQKHHWNMYGLVLKQEAHFWYIGCATGHKVGKQTPVTGKKNTSFYPVKYDDLYKVDAVIATIEYMLFLALGDSTLYKVSKLSSQ